MSTREYELRQVLMHAREAVASLQAGDVGRTFRRFTMATRGLAFYCGLERNPVATAGLRRVLSNLADEIEIAIRPRPLAPAEEVLDVVAEGLRPLQREYPEIEEAILMDRARNLSMGLLGEFEIRVRHTSHRLPT